MMSLDDRPRNGEREKNVTTVKSVRKVAVPFHSFSPKMTGFIGSVRRLTTSHSGYLLGWLEDFAFCQLGHNQRKVEKSFCGRIDLEKRQKSNFRLRFSVSKERLQGINWPTRKPEPPNTIRYYFPEEKFKRGSEALPEEIKI